MLQVGGHRECVDLPDSSYLERIVTTQIGSNDESFDGKVKIAVDIQGAKLPDNDGAETECWGTVHCASAN